MHQILLLNLMDASDVASQNAQPMLYFLNLGLIASGLFMAVVALCDLIAATKESQVLISFVSKKESRLRDFELNVPIYHCRVFSF
jgi:hypothetical protein